GATGARERGSPLPISSMCPSGAGATLRDPAASRALVELPVHSARPKTAVGHPRIDGDAWIGRAAGAAAGRRAAAPPEARPPAGRALIEVRIHPAHLVPAVSRAGVDADARIGRPPRARAAPAARRERDGHRLLRAEERHAVTHHLRREGGAA